MKSEVWECSSLPSPEDSGGTTIQIGMDRIEIAQVRAKLPFYSVDDWPTRHNLAPDPADSQLTLDW